MSGLSILLLILLFISVMFNAFLYYRWHSYRTRSAGSHSYTGMMPRVSRDEILRDREQHKPNPKDLEPGGRLNLRSSGVDNPTPVRRRQDEEDD